MDLIKCPDCGEMFSSSYPRCPFCEEEDAPRRIGFTPTRHIADQKKAQSARGGLIVVLILVLGLLSWYLFGDSIAARFKKTETPEEPYEDEVPAINIEDPFYEPPDNELVTDGPVVGEPPVDANVDVSNAQLSRDDFTLSGTGDSWQLKVSGTEAAPRWSVDNANVATVDGEGMVRAVANGATTVHARVGARTLDCIVRVINTGKTAAAASEPTTAEPVTPAAPSVPNTTQTPAATPSTGTAAPSTPSTDTVNASSLSVKTNYGAVLPKDPGTGYPDCTVRINGDPISLNVAGTDLPVTWKSNDTSIVTISESGKLTPVSAGRTTVTATVGGATITCIIRVK